MGKNSRKRKQSQTDVADGKIKYATRSQVQEKNAELVAKLAAVQSGPKESLLGKIIRLAAEREGPLLDELNKWFLRVRKYANVSVKWRDAVMTSKMLFTGTHNGEERDYLFVSMRDSKKDWTNTLIREGYVRVVKDLTLYMLDANKINLIRQNADDNRIEHVNIYLNTSDQSTTQSLDKLFDKLEKVHTLHFEIEGKFTQEYAEKWWPVMRKAIHCNALPKDIRLMIRHGRENIDWSFANHRTNDGPGSIKTLRFRGYTVFPSLLETQCLEIDMWPLLWSDRRWFNQMNRCYCDTFYWPVPSASTVIVKLSVDNHREFYDKFEEVTATFECDAQLWEKVRKWLVDIHNQYGSLRPHQRFGVIDEDSEEE